MKYSNLDTGNSVLERDIACILERAPRSQETERIKQKIFSVLSSNGNHAQSIYSKEHVPCVKIRGIESLFSQDDQDIIQKVRVSINVSLKVYHRIISQNDNSCSVEYPIRERFISEKNKSHLKKAA